MGVRTSPRRTCGYGRRTLGTFDPRGKFDSAEVLAIVRDVSSCDEMSAAALSILGRLDLHVDEVRHLLMSAGGKDGRGDPLHGAQFHTTFRDARRRWLLDHGFPATA